jgi:PAS domain S-box-containing protein
VPAVWPLLYVFAFAAMCCLASALAAAASAPATKIAWFKVSEACLLPAATAGTCFVLEYVYPGRWLTRRNLTLLALPPLLLVFLIFAGNGQLIWLTSAIGPGGAVVRETATAGNLFTVYALGLTLINVAALLWLFIRSPLHRWPAAMMLTGQLTGRIPVLVNVVRQPWTPPFDPLMVGILICSAFYAIAAFGFRIFDPLPVARQAVLQQMQAGVVIFDARGRALSLNPAATQIFGIKAAAARGKAWHEVTLPAELRPDMLLGLAGQFGDPPEITLGSGSGDRQYAPALSPLRDFRGLLLGYLLVLRDVTEQRRAQAQALEQQRVLTIQNERERMARELHDSLGQVLSYTSLQVETAAQLARDGEGASAAAQLERLGSVVRAAHADLRESILNLHSVASLEKPFFSDARQYLDGYTRSYDIRTLLDVDPALGEGSFPPEMKLQLLRVLQEALSNARQHGRAHQVDVSFRAENGSMQMVIADDGCGFDAEEVANSGSSHLGLAFMRARAEELGGRCEVTSAPHCGTRVALQIPLNTVPPAEDGRSA